ncbi:GNAT family N-acetyltransferase [Erwinia phyllosphaerae]|uniref:GNAT family N-acetyltransferase n=1 Tax=Erwinia phyllosphaerae TaxID=2853256 RepID=UPI001FF04197|nr:GNAT family N-acetyltransferase [Erwinia phyllosphaerae]MBV4366498.1 GNAT family N-acetyltransferase [Erwinia phyllosphaerae]
MDFCCAIPSDHQAIAALHIKASQEAYAGILPNHYLMDILPEIKSRLWEARVGNGVDRKLIHLLLAKEGTTLAGFACFNFNEETEFGTYLHNLYVDSDYRRNGVARRLLSKSIISLPVERIELPVHLCTYTNNFRARLFYENLKGQVIQQNVNMIKHLPEISVTRYQWPSARFLYNALATNDL